MHQALALGRAPQSTWHLILLFRASAEGHARVAMPRPPRTASCSSRHPCPPPHTLGDEVHASPVPQCHPARATLCDMHMVLITRVAQAGWMQMLPGMRLGAQGHAWAPTATLGTRICTREPLALHKDGDIPYVPRCPTEMQAVPHPRSQLSVPKLGQELKEKLRAEHDGMGRVLCHHYGDEVQGTWPPVPATGKLINGVFIS